ncbi:Uncharacterised protein [Mycobacteroides abscessus]|nr:Uncharacterised protein [Mycobacteroides abscessus]
MPPVVGGPFGTDTVVASLGTMSMDLPSRLNTKLKYEGSITRPRSWGTIQGPHGMHRPTQSAARHILANAMKPSLTCDSAFMSVLGVKWSQVQSCQPDQVGGSFVSPTAVSWGPIRSPSTAGPHLSDEQVARPPPDYQLGIQYLDEAPRPERVRLGMPSTGLQFNAPRKCRRGPIEEGPLWFPVVGRCTPSSLTQSRLA